MIWLNPAVFHPVLEVSNGCVLDCEIRLGVVQTHIRLRVSRHSLSLIRSRVFGEFRYRFPPERMETETLGVDPQGDCSGPQEVLIYVPIIPADPSDLLAFQVGVGLCNRRREVG